MKKQITMQEQSERFVVMGFHIGTNKKVAKAYQREKAQR